MRQDPAILKNRTPLQRRDSKRTTKNKIPPGPSTRAKSPTASRKRINTRSRGPRRLQIKPMASHKTLKQTRNPIRLHVKTGLARSNYGKQMKSEIQVVGAVFQGVDSRMVLFGVAVQIFNGVLMQLAVHLGTAVSQRMFCFPP